MDMSLGEQVRWVQSGVGGMKRVRRVIAAGALGASCVSLVGWTDATSSMAAVVRVSATAGAAHRQAQAQKKAVAPTPWEQAELGRETLEAIPEESRTKADYTRAMDGYRAIYHDGPRDVHASAAVNAVAELLAEQGRTLNDEKSLRAALGQYEFLRK